MDERGRVLKAGEITLSAVRRSPEPERVKPDTESRVEMVRRDGVVHEVRVHCECGQVHELELLGQDPEPATEAADRQELQS